MSFSPISIFVPLSRRSKSSKAKLSDEQRSRFFEIALVLVRLDQVAPFIINANHGIMCVAVLAGAADCIPGSVRSVIPEPTKRQCITD